MVDFAKHTRATSTDVYGGAISEETSDTQVRYTYQYNY